jgi:two-component system response regulator MtrA
VKEIDMATDLPSPRLECPSGVEAHHVRRILVAEDDESVARLIALALGRDGHEVVVVGDGAAAVERADRERFDAILLDGRMPVLDGFAACRALRVEHVGHDIPIIMLTAQFSADDAATSLAHGATDYLTKPFSLAQLRARINAWLLRADGSPESSSASGSAT